MSKAIYKVTSKAITQMLIKEQKRKNSFSNKVIKAVQKVLPIADGVTFYEQTWTGSLCPVAIIFKESEISNVDLTKWKKRDRVKHKGKMVWSYWPKKNTKEGKELSKKLSAVMKSESFFQSEELLNLLKYKPKDRIVETSPNRIMSTTISFGMVKKNDKYTFVFRAYPGYEPPRGVKEILMSEYEKMYE